MSFEEFQEGRHLGYRNGTILSILNLCVTVMPPIKFWINPTYGFGRDVVSRITRWPPWRPSWISERNDFSNSYSLCHCNASHQVSAPYFGLTVWEEDGGHLGYRNGTILAILNLHVATMPPTKFHLNSTYHSGRDVKNVKG